MKKSRGAGKLLPLITISIPVYNEEENIGPLYNRLKRLADKMKGSARFEFLFTDNNSTDNTWSAINSLAGIDDRIRGIRFSRNFGFQRSIYANYMHARGDAIMQIDADLQDPPELLENFYELWKQGYHIVYGIRRKRKEIFLINFIRRVGYWFIDVLSEHPVPQNAGDFRLIDRKIIEVLKNHRGTDFYLRGIIAGMGFRQIGVEYDREARVTGKSKFNAFQLFRLGYTAVLNHSTLPLRFASMAGILLLGISMLGGIYYLFLKISNPSLPEGLASVHILVLFSMGFQSLLIGIIGEYLRRVYMTVRSEPIAIIQDTVNVDKKKEGL